MKRYLFGILLAKFGSWNLLDFPGQRAFAFCVSFQISLQLLYFFSVTMSSLQSVDIDHGLQLVSK